MKGTAIVSAGQGDTLDIETPSHRPGPAIGPPTSSSDQTGSSALRCWASHLRTAAARVISTYQVVRLATRLPARVLETFHGTPLDRS
jgi:hypothetical protein